MIQRNLSKMLMINGLLLFFLATAVGLGIFSYQMHNNKAFAQTKMTSVTMATLSNEQAANRAVVEKILPSVVEIHSQEIIKSSPVRSMNGLPFPFFFFQEPRTPRKAEGIGSGVIVSHKGDTYYIITNNHVVANSTKVTVILHDKQQLTAKILGTDPKLDLAVVSVKPTPSELKDLAVASLADSGKVKAGDIVFAVGSPLTLSFSVTHGIVSYVDRNNSPANNIGSYIQTDAPLNEGNSGGPLVNIYGQVIGINTFISTTGQNPGNIGIGFAIPSNVLKNRLPSLIAHKKSDNVYIGIEGISNISMFPNLKSDMGLTHKNGAFVASVVSNSPADKSGIKAGDFITAINGEPVHSFLDLALKVHLLPLDKKAEFTLIRNKKVMKFSFKLGVMTKYVKNDKSFPGFLAVTNSKDVANIFNNIDPAISGVVVVDSYPDGASVVAGIKPGDIITSINGQPIHTVADFYRILDYSHSWDYSIIRDGVRMSIRFSQ